jgi:hypothetical protein
MLILNDERTQSYKHIFQWKVLSTAERRVIGITLRELKQMCSAVSTACEANFGETTWVFEHAAAPPQITHSYRSGLEELGLILHIRTKPRTWPEPKLSRDRKWVDDTHS